MTDVKHRIAMTQHGVEVPSVGVDPTEETL